MLGVVLASLCAASVQGASVERFRLEAFSAAQGAGKVAVLLFHSESCPLCQTQTQALVRLLDEGGFKDVAAFVVDFDRSTELNERFQVSGRATIVVLRGSAEMARASSVGSEAELRGLLRKAFPSKRRGVPKARPANRIPPRP